MLFVAKTVLSDLPIEQILNICVQEIWQNSAVRLIFKDKHRV